jgi:hypothetical protein
MQKAIIIQATRGDSTLTPLSEAALNAQLASGWRFVAAAPFGISSSHGGGSKEKGVTAAILVILEKITTARSAKRSSR